MLAAMRGNISASKGARDRDIRVDKGGNARAIITIAEEQTEGIGCATNSSDNDSMEHTYNALERRIAIEDTSRITICCPGRLECFKNCSILQSSLYH
ncbi:hypothetical protein Trydic_g15562 [Trypoxylus dichotomus]